MKNLIHEIHRRSLWQVLGIYLAVSWIVLQVVDVIGNNFGLPEWVAPAALVLLLLGLPVVVATAFVQEGMTAREPGAPKQSLADVGEVPPPPPQELETRHRLLTWRNALVGGGVAFALLGVLTAGYLFMRASGIGPAGTLVAQGVLEDGAPVVLADFDGPDPDLAAAVSVALQTDLFQSPTIRVVPRTELGDALARMQLDPQTRITNEVAREIAVREGYGAIVEGELTSVGSGYVLTARIVGGSDWAQLAAFRETARGEDDLIDAIEALSRSIRDKSGESLRSVQGGPPLVDVTTGSLEALQLYSRADMIAGDDLAAAELFERATELDPEFAMAHRKLAAMLGNVGTRAADQVAAYTRAYELRDRLPDEERYLAEADYQELVLGDRDAAIRAFESLLELDPENTPALNNLAISYLQRGRLAEAEEMLTRAINVERFDVAFLNLARVRAMRGRTAEMHAALDSGIAALPETAPMLENLRVVLTLAEGDYERARELAGGYLEVAGTPAARRAAAIQQFAIAAVHGRLDEAERHIDDFDLVPGDLGHPMQMARFRSRVAAMRGDSAAAVRGLLEAYEAYRGELEGADLIYDAWVPDLVRLGGGAEAIPIYDEWKEVTPPEQLGGGGRDARRALDALLAGRSADALRLWDEFERECPGFCSLMASLERARIHDALGDRQAAIEAYESFLADRAFFRYRLDGFEKGPALQRLAELYDAEGDTANAARVYDAFVTLWAEADDELQPRVASARSRLAELGGVSE